MKTATMARCTTDRDRPKVQRVLGRMILAAAGRAHLLALARFGAGFAVPGCTLVSSPARSSRAASSLSSGSTVSAGISVSVPRPYLGGNAQRTSPGSLQKASLRTV